MKKQINNVIFVLSFILLLPITLKWIFGYEIPNSVQIMGVEFDSWKVLNAIMLVVISYVIYTNVMEFKAKDTARKEESNE